MLLVHMIMFIWRQYYYFILIPWNDSQMYPFDFQNMIMCNRSICVQPKMSHRNHIIAYVTLFYCIIANLIKIATKMMAILDPDWVSIVGQHWK